MKIAIQSISDENLELVKSYFPGLEVVDTDYDLKFKAITNRDEAYKLIKVLRSAAPYYLQEFID